MTHHRFASLAERTMPDSLHGFEQPAMPSGFIAAPLALLQQQPADVRTWQCQLYQWAFERAQAVVQPSWIERDVLAAWN